MRQNRGQHCGTELHSTLHRAVLSQGPPDVIALLINQKEKKKTCHATASGARIPQFRKPDSPVPWMDRVTLPYRKHRGLCEVVVPTDDATNHVFDADHYHTRPKAPGRLIRNVALSPGVFRNRAAGRCCCLLSQQSRSQRPPQRTARSGQQQCCSAARPPGVCSAATKLSGRKSDSSFRGQQ